MMYSDYNNYFGYGSFNYGNIYFEDDECFEDFEYYDDEYNNEQEVHRKKNTIVLIDAENIGANRCPNIVGQAKSVGEISEMFYFARRNDQNTAAWRDFAEKYGIKPYLIRGGPEHNKIDNVLISFTKGILKTNKSIDVFCLASRDGDYAELISFLRERKKKVVLLATKNTSQRTKDLASEIKGI